MSANTTSAIQSQETPASNPLSWQSAFFAIAGIYFSVFLQRAGSVHGRSAQFCTFLRSSPIVCASDTVVCLIGYLELLWHGHGPVQAARNIWLDRFETRNNVSLGPGGVEPGYEMDGNWRWSMVAFILGTFTQFVKLCACRGIPGTQAVAVTFVSSFAVMEYFRVAAEASKSRGFQVLGSTWKPIITRDIQKGLLTLSVVCQIIVWILVLSIALPWNWFANRNGWAMQLRYFEKTAHKYETLAQRCWHLAQTPHYSAERYTVLSYNDPIRGFAPERFDECATLYNTTAIKYRNASESWAAKPVVWEETNISYALNLTWLLMLSLALLAIALLASRSLREGLAQLSRSMSAEAKGDKFALWFAIMFLSSFFWVPLLALVLYLLMLLFPIFEKLLDIRVFISTARVFAALLISCASSLLLVGFYAIALRVPFLRHTFGLPSSGSWSNAAGLLFLYFNIATMFLYYCRVYGSESTFKAGWTEVFG